MVCCLLKLFGHYSTKQPYGQIHSGKSKAPWTPSCTSLRANTITFGTFNIWKICLWGGSYTACSHCRSEIRSTVGSSRHRVQSKIVVSIAISIHFAQERFATSDLRVVRIDPINSTLLHWHPLRLSTVLSCLIASKIVRLVSFLHETKYIIYLGTCRTYLKDRQTKYEWAWLVARHIPLLAKRHNQLLFGAPPSSIQCPSIRIRVPSKLCLGRLFHRLLCVLLCSPMCSTALPRECFHHCRRNGPEHPLLHRPSSQVPSNAFRILHYISGTCNSRVVRATVTH